MIQSKMLIYLSKFTVNGQIDVWISTQEMNYWANVWRGQRFVCEEIQRKICYKLHTFASILKCDEYQVYTQLVIVS